MAAGRVGGLPGSAELDPFRPALGRLVPQWRQPQSAAGDESLVFLGEATLRLLHVLSPDIGCLLVLEDLHWADRETLALLEYLADNLSAERVLCVGTLRDEEGGGAAVLASVLETRGSAVVLPLGRLDRRRWPAWRSPAWAPLTCRARSRRSLPSGPRASPSWSRRSWPA